MLLTRGLALDSHTLLPTELDNDIVNALPYVHDVVEDAAGGLAIRVNTPRRSNVKKRFVEAYPPIRPVRGISFAEDDDATPVMMRPPPRHPIALLDDPMPEEEAFAHIEASFLLLDRRYLVACLAAAICADARRGQPPMLACSGPSGSAKEQTIRLAASFMGQDIHKADLGEDDEAIKRGLGNALITGAKFILFDEITKTAHLARRLKALLEISAILRWRPLYRAHVETDFRAAIFLPCTYFADFLVKSEEFNRRVRHIHLHRRVPDWRATSGGDTTEWRDRNPENARAANSILTHVWRTCHG